MNPTQPGSRSVSLIIPAFNEESRLPPTLKRVDEWFALQGWDCETLVVDDGSRDQTAAVTESIAQHSRTRIRLLRQPGNLGKGAAVRRGVAEASGASILFSDADLSTPIEESLRLLAELDRGAAVAIGTRASSESRIEVHQPWYREFIGQTGNRLVRWLTGMPFRDTQCGFKAFRSDVARDVFSRMRVDRFGFDIEVLYLALRRGHPVAEVPVIWRNAPGSRVDPVSDTLRVLWDLALIRLRGLTGVYDR